MSMKPVIRKWITYPDQKLQAMCGVRKQKDKENRSGNVKGWALGEHLEQVYY